MADLRPNQRKALEALASGKTTEEAAIIAGVAIRTVFNWRTEPVFKQALQDMTDSTIESATVMLATSALDAIKTLREIAQDKEAKQAVRVSAARAILENVLRLKDQYEIGERIAELERRLESKNDPET